jgi:uroporphyrinogen-III decarboxylase
MRSRILYCLNKGYTELILDENIKIKKMPSRNRTKTTQEQEQQQEQEPEPAPKVKKQPKKPKQQKDLNAPKIGQSNGPLSAVTIPMARKCQQMIKQK